MSNQTSYDKLMNEKLPEQIVYKGKTITIADINAEDSLMDIYPVLLSFCNVNKNFNECELKIWHLILLTMFNSFLSGGFIDNEEIIESLKDMASKFSIEYFINTIMNNAIIGNYSCDINNNVSQQEYDIAKERYFNNIMNSTLKALFIGVTVYEGEAKYSLENIHVLQGLFNKIEIYTLAYQILQKRYGNAIKKIIGSLQVKK
jgi:hypothetical protein